MRAGAAASGVGECVGRVARRPRSALGALPASLRTVLPKAIATERGRFAASLTGANAADRKRALDAFGAGVAAYLYGMPTVLVRLTVANYPTNGLVSIGQLATPASKTVVAPNHDTLYSVSRIDLSAGPQVIDAPATEGRYSVLQLLDASSNVFAYVGAGTDRDTAQTVVLVPPGWQGSVPAGVRVIQSPTRLVWLLGRTLVDSAADLGAARELLAAYHLTPLADWVAGVRAPTLLLDAFPSRPPVVLPTGLGFYDALGAALAADAPPPADACALQAFARAGIGPGLTPSTQADPIVANALTAAAAAGDRLVDAAVSAERRASQLTHNGWSLPASNTGDFGTDYAHRAVTARTALASNTPIRRSTPTRTPTGAGAP